MKSMRPKRLDPDQLDASAITPEVIRAWRSPRAGAGNPQQMNNPLWEWLVKTRLSAAAAREHLCYPAAIDEGRGSPDWSFARSGQTVTPLPDGRIVLIAGEHEDHYNPDFAIYNDVTVIHPDGTSDLYGYGEEVFPPTDFHSATLVGNRIIIMGSLGYPGYRSAGVAQIAELDLTSFAIRLVDSTGTAPGWIHSHIAELAADQKSISICCGLVDTCRSDTSFFLENPDSWSLALDTWHWTRTSFNKWEQYGFFTEGFRWLPFYHFWVLRCSAPTSTSASTAASTSASTSVDVWDTSLFEDKESENMPEGLEDVWKARDQEICMMIQKNNDALAEMRDEALRELIRDGYNPDLEAYAALFVPEIPHTAMDQPDVNEEVNRDDFSDWPETSEEDEEEDDEEDIGKSEEGFGGTRISVKGVIVRYNEQHDRICLTIEGSLDAETVSALTSDLHKKLEHLMNRPVHMQRL